MLYEDLFIILNCKVTLIAEMKVKQDMDILRWIFGLIAICLGIYLLIQLSMFKNELNKAKNKQEQENFAQTWEKKFSRFPIFVVVMVICSIAVIVVGFFDAI